MPFCPHAVPSQATRVLKKSIETKFYKHGFNLWVWKVKASRLSLAFFLLSSRWCSGWQKHCSCTVLNEWMLNDSKVVLLFYCILFQVVFKTIGKWVLALFSFDLNKHRPHRLTVILNKTFWIHVQLVKYDHYRNEAYPGHARWLRIMWLLISRDGYVHVLYHPWIKSGTRCNFCPVKMSQLTSAVQWSVTSSTLFKRKKR